MENVNVKNAVGKNAAGNGNLITKITLVVILSVATAALGAAVGGAGGTLIAISGNGGFYGGGDCVFTY